jgi:pimeloyl-ACP methyl ester carboxylesterase
MNKTLLRVGGAALALAGAAAYVHRRAGQAERAHSPLGHFITVDGVRLHYLDEGQGPPLVLFHGLGSMVEDLVLSGLVREASKHYRVIAFDRPGYGHSERPRRWRFGPGAQARLFAKALSALDVQRPIVFGHSWGTLVAVNLALQAPTAVRSLVLASGLYFPSLRFDMPLLAPPAVPGIGDLMSHTVSPLAARAMWPGWVKMLFNPAPVTTAFRSFPTWMALRPSQLRAQAEEVVFTLPATIRAAARYRELTLPVVLVAGRRDRYVSHSSQTLRLHRILPASRVMISPDAGHMVHHTDLRLILEAVEAAGRPMAAAASAQIGA